MTNVLRSCASYRTRLRRSSLVLPRVPRGDFFNPGPVCELVSGLAQMGVAFKRRPRPVARDSRSMRDVIADLEQA